MIKWITENLRSGDADARRAVLMAAMIVVQGLCAAFYMGDAILDLDGSEPLAHLVLESLVATVLCLGVLFFMLELRRLLARMD
ncbi:hypothetical protein [Ruegeria arenilitoris]|nr:hypothetical protein [Ruegeria arenilitoris]